MPEELERKLRTEAEQRWPNDKKRQDRYVYGGLRAMGWKPEREKKASKAHDQK